MERRGFYANLEVGRGIAALSVALFHVGQIPYLDGSKTLIPGITTEAFSWSGQLFRILGNGPGAVIFFFVLSGFVLTKVLHDGSSNGIPFVVNRLFRIYPAVFCSIGVYYVVCVLAGGTWIGQFSALNVLLNSSLLGTPIVGVMWSLQLELLAVPLLLVVYWAWQKYGFAAIALSYGILLVLSFTSFWNHLIGPPGQFGQIYAFLAGMTVYLYGPEYAQRVTRPVLALVVVLAGFLVARHIIGWSSYFTYWAEATLGSILVALLAFRLKSPGGSHTYDLLRFIGRVSFSFYLLHPLTMHFAETIQPAVDLLIRSGVPPVGVAAVIFLASSAIVLPFAWAQYVLVERPLVKVGHKLIEHTSWSPKWT